jgi:hypothetical protein
VRTAGFVVALGCVFLFVGVAAALFRYCDSADCNDRPDWNAWRQTTADDTAFNSEEGEDRRRDAAGELRHCRSLHGRHKRQVRRLLGNPGETSPGVRGDHTFYAYYLGQDWLGLDSEWLNVEFDGGGRVIRLDVAGG